MQAIYKLFYKKSALFCKIVVGVGVDEAARVFGVDNRCIGVGRRCRYGLVQS